jgi:RluA family pseudouridine synthase
VSPARRRYDLACEVDPYRHGWTLAEFLRARFRYHPPEIWRERIAEGAVRVNGAVVDAEAVVSRGDRVEYTIWHAEPDVDFTHTVLYEDDAVLAVAKSGNLPVHAGGKFIRSTLIAHLRERWGDELRPAHRLDRETSGVVLLAKTRDAARSLERTFRERVPEKRYLAIVRGRAPAELVVDAPIARRAPAEPPYFRVVEPHRGKPAVTRFRRLGVSPPEVGRGVADPDGTEARTPLSLVAAVPEGGRTNQIRVHAAHAGLPILGDKIYGIPPALAREFVEEGPTPAVREAAGAPRHLLHCARLILPHPAGGDLLDLRADPPEDFAAAWPGPLPDVPDPPADPPGGLVDPPGRGDTSDWRGGIS